MNPLLTTDRYWYTLCAGYCATVMYIPTLIIDGYYSLTDPNSVASGFHAMTTTFIGMIAYRILKETFPTMSDPYAIGIVTLLSPMITHALAYLVGSPLTLSFSLTLTGITVAAILTTVITMGTVFVWLFIHHKGPKFDHWERPYIRNLDCLRDLVGTRLNHQHIPYQRPITYDRAFIGIYTAAMFISGWLTSSILATPLANGLLHGTVALIDATSRVVLSRFEHWELNLKSFTSLEATYYSFAVLNTALYIIGMPFNWAPLTSLTALVIAGIALRTLFWSKIELLIYKQPLLSIALDPLPNPQPLSFRFDLDRP